eukprot:3821009-Alexandrium_andersonii.AAC.1
MRGCRAWSGNCQVFAPRLLWVSRTAAGKGSARCATGAVAAMGPKAACARAPREPAPACTDCP